MGCDIHLFVEREVDGKWEVEEGFVSDHYIENSEYFSTQEFKSTPHVIQSRSYTLFSILANVRNYQEVPYISFPRGFPSDISQEVSAYEDCWRDDLHSKSWVSLPELLQFLDSFNHTYKTEVKLGISAYKDYLKTGAIDDDYYFPLMYGNVEVKTDEEMREYVQGKLEEPSNGNVYIIKEVEVETKSHLTSFIEKSIPQIKERSQKEDFSDIRLVFGFDN